MTLDTAAALAQVVAAIVVVVGLFLGIGQLRQLQSQRRDTAAVELIRSLQDADITNAMRLILSLPNGISAADLRARGKEYEDAADLLSVRLEMIGVLVYRDAISYAVMDDLGGPMTVALWKRLENWTQAARIERNHPVWLEWFQWLAEQFMKRNKDVTSPAYERYRNWNPPRT